MVDEKRTLRTKGRGIKMYYIHVRGNVSWKTLQWDQIKPCPSFMLSNVNYFWVTQLLLYTFALIFFMHFHMEQCWILMTSCKLSGMAYLQYNNFCKALFSKQTDNWELIDFDSTLDSAMQPTTNQCVTSWGRA